MKEIANCGIVEIRAHGRAWRAALHTGYHPGLQPVASVDRPGRTPEAVGVLDLLESLDSEALPLDSEAARILLQIQPDGSVSAQSAAVQSDVSDGVPLAGALAAAELGAIPDYWARMAEAVNAYAEWLADRVGGRAIPGPTGAWWDALPASDSTASSLLDAAAAELDAV